MTYELIMEVKEKILDGSVPFSNVAVFEFHDVSVLFVCVQKKMSRKSRPEDPAKPSGLLLEKIHELLIY